MRGRLRGVDGRGAPGRVAGGGGLVGGGLGRWRRSHRLLYIDRPASFNKLGSSSYRRVARA